MPVIRIRGLERKLVALLGNNGVGMALSADWMRPCALMLFYQPGA